MNTTSPPRDDSVYPESSELLSSGNNEPSEPNFKTLVFLDTRLWDAAKRAAGHYGLSFNQGHKELAVYIPDALPPETEKEFMDDMARRAGLSASDSINSVGAFNLQKILQSMQKVINHDPTATYFLPQEEKEQVQRDMYWERKNLRKLNSQYKKQQQEIKRRG